MFIFVFRNITPLEGLRREFGKLKLKVARPNRCYPVLGEEALEASPKAKAIREREMLKSYLGGGGCCEG